MCSLGDDRDLMGEILQLTRHVTDLRSAYNLGLPEIVDLHVGRIGEIAAQMQRRIDAAAGARGDG